MTNGATMTSQRATREDLGGLPGGEGIRERLLKGMPVVDRKLELAGVPTAVLEGGDGPPMVLLHGAGEFAAVWMRVIPELVQTHRVIAPDLPGHGASDVPDSPLSAERMLAWLDELIGSTCPSPPVLVCHLLGGGIGARLACDHGTQISQLVLVDSFGLGRLLPSPRFALSLLRFIVRPTERSQESLFRQCMVDLDKVREQMGEHWDLMAA